MAWHSQAQQAGCYNVVKRSDASLRLAENGLTEWAFPLGYVGSRRRQRGTAVAAVWAKGEGVQQFTKKTRDGRRGVYRRAG